MSDSNERPAQGDDQSTTSQDRSPAYPSGAGARRLGKARPMY